MTSTSYLRRLASLALVACALGFLPGSLGRAAQASPTPRWSLWTMSADGTGESLLAEGVSPHTGFEWSPTDGRLTYSSNGDIYISGVSGELINVTSTPVGGTSAYEVTPTWSPDATRLAFEAGGDLFTMDVEGSNRSVLTAGPEGDRYPRWGPSGDRIAYLSGPDHAVDPVVLNVVDTDEGGVRTLAAALDGPASFEWSPDGTRIAFITPEGHLSVVDAATGTVSQVSTLPDSRTPTWSPDGSRIAFYADGGVWLIDADGTRDEPRTMGGIPEGGLDWSPDGRKLLVGGYDMMWLDIETYNSRPLTASDERDMETTPRWSLAGTKIAFLGRTWCCAVTHSDRIVSLTMGRHLVARGRVAAMLRECHQEVRVRIMRRIDGDWLTIRTLRTERKGTFRVRLPDRPGRYRAVVRRVRVDGPNGTVICRRDVSWPVRHRH